MPFVILNFPLVILSSPLVILSVAKNRNEVEFGEANLKRCFAEFTLSEVEGLNMTIALFKKNPYLYASYISSQHYFTKKI